jgi:hypothetical protein
MPRGPKGEKRPADVIGNAVHVMRIATGDVEKDQETRPKTEASSWATEAGIKGGRARAASLTDDERKRIARKAAKARWRKKRDS